MKYCYYFIFFYLMWSLFPLIRLEFDLSQHSANGSQTNVATNQEREHLNEDEDEDEDAEVAEWSEDESFAVSDDESAEQRFWIFLCI